MTLFLIASAFALFATCLDINSTDLCLKVVPGAHEKNVLLRFAGPYWKIVRWIWCGSAIAGTAIWNWYWATNAFSILLFFPATIWALVAAHNYKLARDKGKS